MDQKTLRAPLSRLDRACKYLEDKWFPCSSHILNKIEELTRQDMNATNQGQILDLIRQDYSLTLFLYKELCSKEMTEIINKSDDLQNSSPIDVIEVCPPKQLIDILKDSLPTLRLHSLESSKSYQLERLKEALLALITTKTLCEQSTVDPDLGAEVSLFRQLGFLLVAWNYPSIYQAASLQVSASQSLDDNLVKALGFSPSSLALSLAQKWGLSKIFKESAQDLDQDSILAPDETSSIAKSITKLCEVGEKLARANNPGIYPTALHDWEDAKGALQAALGSEGLALIDRAMTRECEDLFINSPFIFKAGSLLNLESHLLELESKRNAERNPYITSCGEDLKSDLLSLYELIVAGERAEKTVNILLRKILPHAGFHSSALFTLEPGTKRLALQLKAGEIKLRQGQNLQDMPHKEIQDIVPLAFHSAEVLSQDINQKIHCSELMPACLATFFGCSQRFGVFYVEVPSQNYQQDRDSFHERLKALAFTLNDCLELV